MEGYGESKQRHPDGAERDKAILNLSRGKKTRGVAAKAYAYGKRRLQVAAVRFVDVQNFAAVKDNHELEQRAEEPEVSIAHDGEVQSAVWPDDLNLLYQIAKNVEAKFP
jgi:hypothetical protein